MAEHILLGLVSIIVLGIGAEWLAWRLHLPSVLLLLIFGIVVGPVVGFLNPEALLGDLLLKPAAKVAGERAYKEAFHAVRFASAELGRNSGVLGAAAFALQEMRKPICE